MVGSMAMGFAMGLISLVGLILASGAVDGAMYVNGMALFCFGVLFIYGMIQKYAGGRDS